MAKWIRVIDGLPVIEVKPAGPEGFTDAEFVGYIGTPDPSQMFPTDDGVTVLLYNDESRDPINERACALLSIPTARDLRARLLAHGTEPDEDLLAREDNQRAWEIRGNVLLGRVREKKRRLWRSRRS